MEINFSDGSGHSSRRGNYNSQSALESIVHTAVLDDVLRSECSGGRTRSQRVRRMSCFEACLCLEKRRVNRVDGRRHRGALPQSPMYIMGGGKNGDAR